MDEVPGGHYGEGKQIPPTSIMAVLSVLSDRKPRSSVLGDYRGKNLVIQQHLLENSTKNSSDTAARERPVIR